MPFPRVALTKQGGGKYLKPHLMIGAYDMAVWAKPLEASLAPPASDLPQHLMSEQSNCPPKPLSC
jgi:hypothetical protein